jgi:hypothetical protein
MSILRIELHHSFLYIAAVVMESGNWYLEVERLIIYV